MPLYEIFHAIALSPIQQSDIANGITDLHCGLFRRPRLFANVIFHHETGTVAFAGGKPSSSNRVLAHIRTNDRLQSDYDTIAAGIAELWKTHALDPQDEQTRLRGVFITGTILSAIEGGYKVPRPGEEAAWAKDNIEEITRRATTGDEEAQDLLHDIATNKWLGAL